MSSNDNIKKEEEEIYYVIDYKNKLEPKNNIIRIKPENKETKENKQRKIEKNKSMNKLFISTSLSQSQTANLDKNKKKENKDNFNYLEHTVTTDLSLAETNNENKTDKILKGSEKLNELFIKASVFYKLFGNKSNEVNLCINKENQNIIIMMIKMIYIIFIVIH